jgi:ParB family chromosome partitioning protein
MTRKALGRGLEALIPRMTGEPTPVISGEKVTIPVDWIRPNPWQPRRSPDPLKMDELARSIQARGVLEPVLVRPVAGKYELVAGERRLRAAQRIGMKEIPAIIVNLTDKESLEVALVENLQREDLSPVDEARAYQILVEEFERTHDQIAEQVGKDRSTVSNLIRLLKLPEIVLDSLATGALTVGHARALLVEGSLKRDGRSVKRNRGLQRRRAPGVERKNSSRRRIAIRILLVSRRQYAAGWARRSGSSSARRGADDWSFATRIRRISRGSWSCWAFRCIDGSDKTPSRNCELAPAPCGGRP